MGHRKTGSILKCYTSIELIAEETFITTETKGVSGLVKKQSHEKVDASYLLLLVIYFYFQKENVTMDIIQS